MLPKLGTIQPTKKSTHFPESREGFYVLGIIGRKFSSIHKHISNFEIHSQFRSFAVFLLLYVSVVS